jgi:hypothetical protein
MDAIEASTRIDRSLARPLSETPIASSLGRKSDIALHGSVQAYTSIFGTIAVGSRSFAAAMPRTVPSLDAASLGPVAPRLRRSGLEKAAALRPLSCEARFARIAAKRRSHFSVNICVNMYTAAADDGRIRGSGEIKLVLTK